MASKKQVNKKKSKASKNNSSKVKTKKAVSKKAVSKKAPAKKAVSKKTPAKKTVAKKAPAKKTVAKKSSSKKSPTKKIKLQYSVGDFIVYPSHGVGEITDIQTFEIAEEKLEMYNVIFDKEKMTLKIPTIKAKEIGIRKVSSRNEMKKTFGCNAFSLKEIAIFFKIAPIVLISLTKLDQWSRLSKENAATSHKMSISLIKIDQ